MITDKKERKLTFISLFSGCGGLDIGFEQQGFTCLGAFDNDPSVLSVYKENMEGPTYLHDLSSHSLPVELGAVDVLVAGSPCQGFSTAGLRNLDDPRNSLLLVSGSIAAKLSPKVVVCENVMGSLSGKHKMYWQELETRLSGLGYTIDFVECYGVDFGLAQIRKRIFLIASKGTKPISVLKSAITARTLKEVLTNVDGLPNQKDFIPIKDDKTTKLVNRIKPGQKLCNVRGGVNSVHTWDIPEVFGDIDNMERYTLVSIKKLRRSIRLRKSGDADPVAIEDLQQQLPFPVNQVLERLISKGYVRKIGERFDLKHSYNGLYRRLEWDKYSLTVDTRFGNPRFFLHPDENRGFTVREAARIQGFPDYFKFKGSLSTQFKMIGNAVPPPMACGIADAIKRSL